LRSKCKSGLNFRGKMNPKFIIQGDKLIISKCEFHRDIADLDKPVKGGGWFRYDKTINRFRLYGKSEEFGEATLKDIRRCFEVGLVVTHFLDEDCISKNHTFVYEKGHELVLLN